MSMPADKYRPYGTVDLPDRRWPSRVIETAPLWCSVDLRDGNQALVDPMDAERKLAMFEHLVRLGFKEIEVGFPSSSQIEFDFARRLIEEGRIPDDVTIQVLTQARRELIETTMESIRGARRAILHLYNSTSTLQRRVVFRTDKAGITDIAVRGTECVRAIAEQMPETDVVLEYSPESFTGTELDYAAEICESVMDVWEPTADKPIILNLPSTVEMSTPNVFADRIEWFDRNVARRDAFLLSVHPHNDRGCAVASAELAVMAGAQRVEGTLLGNGERTGNVDLVTLGLNLLTQGVDPELDLSDVNEIVRTVEHCNRLPVHPRHPYVGDLVFTAFSGSHQDAIKKGIAAVERGEGETWEVPYLPMDPIDVGRSYEAVIRINSQSGKGGIAYVLEQQYGLQLPRRQQVEFRQVVQRIADECARELAPDEIWQAFEREYFDSGGGYRLEEPIVVAESAPGRVRIEARVATGGESVVVSGEGNGPIDAFVDGIAKCFGEVVRVSDFREHGVGRGADAEAVAYVELIPVDGKARFGVGRHASTVTASLAAVLSAVNRARRTATAEAMAATGS